MSTLRPLLISLVAVVIAGCSATPRSTTAIDLYPVVQTFSIASSGAGESRALELWAAFLANNTEALQDKTITLYANQRTSQALLDRVERDLKALHVTQSNLGYQPLATQEADGFDFKVELLQYHVVTQDCEATSVHDRRQFGLNGCHVRDARWQSMVAPEKMLPEQDRSLNIKRGE